MENIKIKPVRKLRCDIIVDDYKYKCRMSELNIKGDYGVSNIIDIVERTPKLSGVNIMGSGIIYVRDVELKDKGKDEGLTSVLLHSWENPQECNLFDVTLFEPYVIEHKPPYYNMKAEKLVCDKY